jgi:hypothetical protein
MPQLSQYLIVTASIANLLPEIEFAGSLDPLRPDGQFMTEMWERFS